jgi:hypothetical protein
MLGEECLHAVGEHRLHNVDVSGERRHREPAREVRAVGLDVDHVAAQLGSRVILGPHERFSRVSVLLVGLRGRRTVKGVGDISQRSLERRGAAEGGEDADVDFSVTA